MNERGTFAALTLGDAGEVLTLLQRAAFVAETQANRGLHIPALTQTLSEVHAELLFPPQVRTIGLFTGQHSHANLRLYRRHGYRQTHTTQAGAYLLIHLAKDRPRRPSAASSRPGRS